MHRVANKIYSSGTLGEAVHDGYCHWPSLDLAVLLLDCLVWIQVAYRLHDPESFHVGIARKLYSPGTEGVVEFHLDGVSM